MARLGAGWKLGKGIDPRARDSDGSHGQGVGATGQRPKDARKNLERARHPFPGCARPAAACPMKDHVARLVPRHSMPHRVARHLTGKDRCRPKPRVAVAQKALAPGTPAWHERHRVSFARSGLSSGNQHRPRWRNRRGCGQTELAGAIAATTTPSRRMGCRGASASKASRRERGTLQAASSARTLPTAARPRPSANGRPARRGTGVHPGAPRARAAPRW